MTYSPSKKEFLKLAKKGNLIPIYRELLADLETPVSAFLKLGRGDYSYLLESVEGEERIARYSFLGTNTSLIFKSKDNNIEIIEKDTQKRFKVNRFLSDRDPLFEIKRLMSRYKFVQLEGGLPRFCGGLVGYLSYDMARNFEPCLRLGDKKIIDDLKLPDAIFVLADTLVIFDHREHKIKIVSNAYVDKDKPLSAYQRAIERIGEVVKKLNRQAKRADLSLSRPSSFKIPNSNISKQEFKDILKRAKNYIRRGDIIQVVLSQRFKTKLNSHPFNIYRALRSLNPSAYMYYLRFGALSLVGSSPEILVRCEDRVIQTRPIAGTRPRGRNELEDIKIAKGLLKDKKERAEHIMLVDLGRNDVGRVAQYRTMELSEFMSIERYSHVMHIVSDIQGRLRKGKDIYDVLRSCFPAGTVTGSPKIRAMEIIDELEKTKRGPYAGCVGYFSFSGNLDTCITIRTIVVKGNRAYIQAGAGIVADSHPEREYEETINKAKALIEAIHMAH